MNTSEQYILVINAGSSSIKSVVYTASDLAVVCRVSIEGIGQAQTYLFVQNNHTKVSAGDHAHALELILTAINKQVADNRIVAVGYRVVFSGPNLRTATVLTKETIAELEAYASYDPDHMPNILAVIQSLGERIPKARHVACFDTAFFAVLPRVARILPIPHEYEEKGVMVYGYHGLSYTYLLRQLQKTDPELARGKIVFAHLGSGASLSAVVDGKPIDTTMSFSPTSGIPMSTRSGDLDPGVASFLIEHEKLDSKSFSHLVNARSGLLGISGLSADMYTLLQNSHANNRASDAVDKFCYEVKKSIAGFAGAMGGLDGLVFTGGIGERSAPVRSRICDGMSFLGIELNEAKNKNSSQIISKAGTISVRVMHTDEESVIAHQTKQLL